MSAAVVATAHFLHRLILIDTTPHGIVKMPRVREGTWDAMARRRRNNRIGPRPVSVSNRRTASYEGLSRCRRWGFAVRFVSAYRDLASRGLRLRRREIGRIPAV